MMFKRESLQTRIFQPKSKVAQKCFLMRFEKAKNVSTYTVPIAQYRWIEYIGRWWNKLFGFVLERWQFSGTIKRPLSSCWLSLKENRWLSPNQKPKHILIHRLVCRSQFELDHEQKKKKIGADCLDLKDLPNLLFDYGALKEKKRTSNDQLSSALRSFRSNPIDLILAQFAGHFGACFTADPLLQASALPSQQHFGPILKRPTFRFPRFIVLETGRFGLFELFRLSIRIFSSEERQTRHNPIVNLRLPFDWSVHCCSQLLLLILSSLTVPSSSKSESTIKRNRRPTSFPRHNLTTIENVRFPPF
jgi:hypothetical protein